MGTPIFALPELPPRKKHTRPPLHPKARMYALKRPGPDLLRGLRLKHHVRVAADVKVPVHQALDRLVLKESQRKGSRDPPTATNTVFLPPLLPSFILSNNLAKIGFNAMPSEEK